MKTRMAVGLVLFIISGAFVTFGAYLCLSVDERIRDSKPVSVQVLSSELRRNSGRHWTYSPVIRYRYDVDGTAYENDAYEPFDVGGGSSQWAQSAVDRHKPGKSYTGFFVPAHPQDSFLVRWHYWWPYLLWVIPCAPLNIGLLIILFQLPEVTPRVAPSRTDAGWFTINVFMHQAQKVSLLLFVLLLWCGLAGAGIAHYFIVDERPYDWQMYAVTAIFLAITLAAAYHWITFAGSLVFLEEPKLLIERERAVPGQVMRVKIGLHPRLCVFINELSLSLVLRSDGSTEDGDKTSDSSVSVHQVATNRWLQRANMQWIESTVKFPENCSPTSTGEYSSTDWFIQVSVKMFGRIEEDLMFPILVDEMASTDWEARTGA